VTPALLAQAGALLHGERWRLPLARDLGVASRTVERWAAGTVPIPEGLVHDVRQLVVDRIEDLEGLHQTLYAMAQKAPV